MSGRDAPAADGHATTDGSGAAGPDPAEVERAVAFVLRSTRSRPQSEAQVAAKLRRRGHGDDTVAAALARARALGAVDDAAFARAWVEDRSRRRGFAVARVREELARRGVPAAAVDAALAALADRDDHTTAVRLARQHHRRLPAGLDEAGVLRRLGGYLARRGYPPGLAERAAREAAGLRAGWD